ncbi:MAG: ABC transporter substrate-binding protein [Defluviicoccus sp.]|nr:ABC transporter substrate-binding protein [Defluviicoccus sp.]MDE0277066.1 ABC transporter substrate-binding protein [Defluviicoccus sp.]
MAKLPVTIATGDYDRVRPIVDGRVAVEGCEVAYFPIPIEETSYRTFTNAEFDVAEVSLSSFVLARSRGAIPYIGLPVFTSRMFRHSAVYVRADSGIESPGDLKGREVGVPVYAMTAALWVRGMLAEEYGVRPSDIVWRTGGLEQPGRYGAYPLDLPPGIEVRPLPPERSLSAMLAAGELPALVSARAPSCFGAGGGPVRRLFPDYRAAEEAYYRKTGLYPIMHLVAMRESLAEAHPWLPASLYKAFRAAKNIAVAALDDVTAPHVSVPWIAAEVERTRALLGRDIWPYGFQDNLRELEAVVRYSHAQGLAVRELDPAELFHPSTRESARV